MQYDMLFHTTSKKEYDGQDFKVKKLETTHGHPKTIHHHKYRQVQANKLDK